MACADAPRAITASALAQFRSADLELLAKREIRARNVRALDGSTCRAKTEDGVARGYDDGECADLGDSYFNMPALDWSHSHTPLIFFPPRATVVGGIANPQAIAHALRLRSAVAALQSPGDGQRCRDKAFYMHELPQVGFGSVIEYATMFLGRSLSLGTQFRIGPDSSRAWTSSWFCGDHGRSLGCYFNLSACCAIVLDPSSVGGRQPLRLPRRRDPINVAARGFNEYGSAWVSAQMTRYLFDRATPSTRAEITKRRQRLGWPPSGQPAAAIGGGADGADARLVIGMHIRGGDSCLRGRYCPANLTSSYFAAAARLRSLYGANRILLATDNAEAARLCAARVLGFECATQSIERKKFEASDKIEDRVALHNTGALSGSAVALDALADMDMLADCDMFVMLLRSCFARVAYALAMGRKSRPPPIISLEAPWSPFKGAMKGGKGGKGGKFGMRKMKMGAMPHPGGGRAARAGKRGMAMRDGSRAGGGAW
jgi:hypothetical protein